MNDLKKVGMLCLCLLFILASACDNKNDGSKGEPYDPNQPVTLGAYYPQKGGMATKVILNGSNFGNDPSKIRVYFNHKRAAVVSSIGSQVYVITPKQPGDTCKISIVVGKDSLVYDQDFYYHTSVTVTTVVGHKGTKAFKGGTLADAEFDGPFYLYVDHNDNIFLSHWKYQSGPANFVLINQKGNSVTELLNASGAAFNIPGPDPNGNILVPLDAGYNYYSFGKDVEWAPKYGSILQPTAEQQANGSQTFTINYKHSFTTNVNDKMVYTRSHNGQLVRFDPKTRTGELVATGLMPNTDGFIMFHPVQTNVLYLVYRTYNCIYTYNLDTKVHELYAGSQGIAGWRDGYRTDAEFKEPRQITFADDGIMYIADYGNHDIRSITPEGMVSTVVGIPGKQGYQDGNPDDALFDYPAGVAIDKDNNVYVADYHNNCIRKLSIE